eukprot:10056973-Lingulodinium_polyedra.AAC.1
MQSGWPAHTRAQRYQRVGTSGQSLGPSPNSKMQRGRQLSCSASRAAARHPRVAAASTAVLNLLLTASHVIGRRLHAARPRA